jgi:hypothetical protein
MLSADIERARKMKRHGESYAQIAREFGISETSARYWTDDDFRRVTKEKALARSTKKYRESSSEEKKEKNQKTIETLIRKREIQPEYKKYSDETHYRYAKTPQASKTRKRYWSKNKTRLNELQKIQYDKHKQKRLAGRRQYYKENREKILEKMRKAYAEKKKH